MATIHNDTEDSIEADDSAVERAIKRGATFERTATGWCAILRKRGRQQPLATFTDVDKAEAATLFLLYTNHHQTRRG